MRETLRGGSDRDDEAVGVASNRYCRDAIQSPIAKFGIILVIADVPAQHDVVIPLRLEEAAIVVHEHSPAMSAISPCLAIVIIDLLLLLLLLIKIKRR